MSLRELSHVFVRRHPRHHIAKTERRHPSPSAGQIATRFAEVQMRVDLQWLHGRLWRPRDQAQPLVRRWVKEPIPSRDNAGSTPMWKTGESSTPFMSQQRWLNQFAKLAEAQRNQRHHFHKKYSSGTFF